MIPKGLFSQIAMIIISIGIAVTYIQPTFGDINQMQNEISVYNEEREKVSRVNEQLATLINRLDTISAEDQRALLTYIPNDVDTIAVPRDLQFIAEEAGVLFEQVAYESVSTEHFTDEQINKGYPVPQVFSVDVEGTYTQIKRFISLLEQNNYPLEVHGLDIEVTEGGVLNTSVQIITYSHLQPEIIAN